MSNFNSPSKTRSLCCHSPREDIFASVPGNNAINVIAPRVTPILQMGVILVTLNFFQVGLTLGVGRRLQRKEKITKVVAY